ncbi:hypothetical protein NEUTE1DRAFT_76111 [Neurospora tetrasperma FGSC 2508]|uniref:Uncharacterized protein n=1 Tax=Neurospora tetrasperma (strain FGSC 2508 / ATCC MYA-4615 / P0657) TaxID=510951 RepID=F8MDY8_NEUT8|nr:uncharacterized protein NEUTE1DRAFT_76111 [Neurospora tetrasperma FGSC 2508]EGO60725.1 hypothetical protein NEUTE1DRAFT_76111 [Neurospora tetrasperma FGSC 2508]EGZ75287.1 hypothetical protein NEUTE2DRAFT_104885 [Neurospora tetrasperma FGSC 2509]
MLTSAYSLRRLFSTGETDVASATPDTSKSSCYGTMGHRTHIAHAMCGFEHETRKRDTPITQLSQAGHSTFHKDNSRSSSVYDEIVESYSDTAPKRHQEEFSSTARNTDSQPALRREEWSTGAQPRNKPTSPRLSPRNGTFFDAFRNQQYSGYLKPPPLSASISRPVETARPQGRSRSSPVPLMHRQTSRLSLFPRIDHAPTVIPSPSYSAPEISTPSHYPASSTAISVSSTRPLTAAPPPPPVPPKDTSLRPPVPRKDTPSLPPLRVPSQTLSTGGDASMRNPIKGPALYTQPRPVPSTPGPCRHQRQAMRLNTPYMQMLLALDKIPRLHNILVSCFTWLLLVAFIIVTGSFHTPSGSVVYPMEPWFAVSLGCMALGILGCLWLGIRWRRNYVWLINRLYMPLFLNGVAGVLATLVSVYAQHEGGWCFPAVIAMVVEGVLMVVSVVLLGVYNFWLLRRVKKFKNGYYGRGRKEWEGEEKEERFKSRGWNAPPHAPGSIV